MVSIPLFNYFQCQNVCVEYLVEYLTDIKVLKPTVLMVRGGPVHVYLSYPERAYSGF